MPSKYGFVTDAATDVCRQGYDAVSFVYKSVKHKRGKAWGRLASLGMLNVKVDTCLWLFIRP